MIRSTPPVTAKAFDLIITIRKLMAQSPLEFKGRHIKGHQDRHKSGKRLSRWEALNVAMDKAAKRRLRQALQGEPATNQRLSGERMVVTHCGVKQSQIHKKALCQEICGKVIKAK